ncbi:hypothetical protein [Paenibacillus sp. 37]|uniref:hypothetical protein n=1 Tax=Paenibacillus sp. 37 TaxID=2607911 RepID=UPI00122E25D4|nr:hypothetical protein [Paenibacillus sp. 37]
MSNSILIEVDEMTRKIMETLQTEMHEGSQRALGHMKDDIVTSIESVQRILKQFEHSNQRLTNDSHEQVESLRRDVDQMQQSVNGITSSIQGELDTVSQRLLDQITKLSQRMDTISTTLNQFMELTVQIPQVTTSLQAIQEQSVGLSEQAIQQAEDTSRILEILHEQQKQNAATQELLIAEIQKLEDEIAWHNRPLLKKWFGGGKKTK